MRQWEALDSPESGLGPEACSSEHDSESSGSSEYGHFFIGWTAWLLKMECTSWGGNELPHGIEW
jgi:hypothetical protein